MSGTDTQVKKRATPLKSSAQKPEWWRWDGGWYEVDGDRTRYCNWELTGQSVVFEIGGYEGQWAQRIAQAYHPQLYVFEPAERAYKAAKEKIGSYPGVYLFNFGLGIETKDMVLGDADRDGASLVSVGVKPTQTVKVMDIVEFIEGKGIAQIDLMAVNIEGYEFFLLPHIIESGIVRMVKWFMLQWHSIAENSHKKQLEIQENLARTHRMLWNHGSWEAWEWNGRKSA